MSSGCRPMIGTNRSICTLASTTSSPSRDRPASEGEGRPEGDADAEAPGARAGDEAHRASPSVPSRARSQPAVSTADGPARTSGGSHPARARQLPQGEQRDHAGQALERRGGRGAAVGGRRAGRRGSARRTSVGAATAGSRRDRRRGLAPAAGGHRGRRVVEDVGHPPCTSCTRSLNRVSNSADDVELGSGIWPASTNRSASTCCCSSTSPGRSTNDPTPCASTISAARSGVSPYWST